MVVQVCSPNFFTETIDSENTNEDEDNKKSNDDKEKEIDCNFCSTKLYSSLMPHHLWAAHEGEAEKWKIPNPFTPDNITNCPYCDRSSNVKSFDDHLSYFHSVVVHPKIKLIKIYGTEKQVEEVCNGDKDADNEAEEPVYLDDDYDNDDADDAGRTELTCLSSETSNLLKVYMKY